MYDEEIKTAIYRIEQEIADIEREIKELNSKIEQLQTVKNKKERDIRVLKSHFGEDTEKKETQTSLIGIV